MEIEGPSSEKAVVSHVGSLHVRIVVLLSGAVLMALEILAFRIVARTFGTALRETSAVIAVFLAAMSAGYWWGGRAVDRRPRPALLAIALAGAALLLFLVAPLDSVVAPGIAGSAVPIPLQSGLVCVVLFFLPTLLLATASPIGVRLEIPERDAAGRTAGALSAISTVGSILGSLVAGFWLLDRIGSIAGSLRLLGATAALLALSFLVRPAFAARPRLALAVSGLALALAGAGLLSRLAAPPEVDVDEERLSRNSPGRVLVRRDSPFHSVVVFEADGKRVLSFDGTVQSTMSLTDPFDGGLPYTDFFHLPMAIRPGIRSVLFVGLGGGTGPRAFRRDYPEVEIDAVDIDPVVVEVARRWFGVVPDDRLRIHVEDGRTFLRGKAERTWDLVIVDAGTRNRYGLSLPAHLTTREYFEEIARHLSPHGIVMYHSPGDYRMPISRSLAKTLASVFPTIFVAGRENGLIFASRDEYPPTRAEVAEAVRQGLAAGRLRDPRALPAAEQVIDVRVPFADVPVLTDDSAPVDALMAKSRR